MFMSIPLYSNLATEIDRGERRFNRWEEKNEVRRREEGDEVALEEGWEEEKMAMTS